MTAKHNQQLAFIADVKIPIELLGSALCRASTYRSQPELGEFELDRNLSEALIKNSDSLFHWLNKALALCQDWATNEQFDSLSAEERTAVSRYSDALCNYPRAVAGIICAVEHDQTLQAPVSLVAKYDVDKGNFTDIKTRNVKVDDLTGGIWSQNVFVDLVALGSDKRLIQCVAIPKASGDEYALINLGQLLPIWVTEGRDDAVRLLLAEIDDLIFMASHLTPYMVKRGYLDALERNAIFSALLPEHRHLFTVKEDLKPKSPPVIEVTDAALFQVGGWS